MPRINHDIIVNHDVIIDHDDSAKNDISTIVFNNTNNDNGSVPSDNLKNDQDILVAFSPIIGCCILP